MSQLRVGQPAPILEGNDLFQKRIRLSDFLGKIVILTLSTTNSDPEVYAGCKQLLNEFKGRPVVCLSVVPSDGSGGYSVRSIVRDMGITWPIIRDMRGSRLASRWCEGMSAEVYIIDPQGLIRSHQGSRHSMEVSLSEAIKKLLEAPKPALK